MRHRKSGRKLGRNASHRSALFNNLVTSLLEYGRIETTESKAKELRRFADADHLVGRVGPGLDRQGRQGERGGARQARPRAPHGPPDRQDPSRDGATVRRDRRRTSTRARAATPACSRRACARATRRRWRWSSSSVLVLRLRRRPDRQRRRRSICDTHCKTVTNAPASCGRFVFLWASRRRSVYGSVFADIACTRVFVAPR